MAVPNVFLPAGKTKTPCRSGETARGLQLSRLRLGKINGGAARNRGPAHAAGNDHWHCPPSRACSCRKKEERRSGERKSISWAGVWQGRAAVVKKNQHRFEDQCRSLAGRACKGREIEFSRCCGCLPFAPFAVAENRVLGTVPACLCELLHSVFSGSS